MNPAMLVTLLFLSILGSLVTAQTSTTDARRCVAGSGVTTFPACRFVDSYFSNCSSYASVGSSLDVASSSSAATSYAYQYYNCFCAQSYLNALYDCNSEMRLCLGKGGLPDAHLSEQLSIWHKGCDTALSYSPTTPIQSSITASYNIDVCRTLELSCASLNNERDQCIFSQHSGPQLTSCLCQPPLLSLAYDCSVLVNVSCIQVPAHLTQMAEYGNCPNLADVITIPESLVRMPNPDK
jgi:hypothetical protein